jgi:murein DD-endopeptidase MepM/ murein hydrolase activator NlpD
MALNQLDGPPAAPLPTDLALALPSDSPALYRVRSGDTLTSLGRHFGVSVASLTRQNDIRDANRLRVGTWLTIPAGARTACAPRSVRTASEPPSATPIDGLVSAGASEPVPASIDSADPRTALDHASTVIRAAEARYEAADFPGALALVGVARHILDPLAPNEEVETLAARVTWLSGLALVGLDRSQDAIEEFRIALQRDPSLASEDPLSPKVAALVEAAKSEFPGVD